MEFQHVENVHTLIIVQLSKIKMFCSGHSVYSFDTFIWIFSRNWKICPPDLQKGQTGTKCTTVCHLPIYILFIEYNMWPDLGKHTYLTGMKVSVWMKYSMSFLPSNFIAQFDKATLYVSSFFAVIFETQESFLLYRKCGCFYHTMQYFPTSGTALNLQIGSIFF